jgi:hypothetical protein
VVDLLGLAVIGEVLVMSATKRIDKASAGTVNAARHVDQHILSRMTDRFFSHSRRDPSSGRLSEASLTGGKVPSRRSLSVPARLLIALNVQALSTTLATEATAVLAWRCA